MGIKKKEQIKKRVINHKKVKKMNFILYKKNEFYIYFCLK